MGRMNDIMDGRNQGILLAYKIASESGIEELQREIEYRNLMNVSLNIPRKELEVATINMRLRATEVAITFALTTLIDEFNFSKFQARKFKDSFDQKVESILNDEVTLEQMIKRINNELDIEMVVRD